MSTFLESASSIVSYPISYDSIKILLMLVSSVFIGYTLQPVPKWLNKLFDTSFLFKFFIIFISGLIAVFPISPRKFIYVLIFSIITLALFSASRYVDKIIEKKNKETNNLSSSN